MRFAKLAVCFLAIATLPSLVQAQDAAKKLVGKWEAKLEVDEEKLKKVLTDSGLPVEQLDMILPQVKAQFANAKITMEFMAEGKAKFKTEGIPQASEEQDGKWEILKEDGDSVVIKTLDKGGKAEESTIKFDGNDKFTLSAKGLEEAPVKPPVFKRVKKSE